MTCFLSTIIVRCFIHYLISICSVQYHCCLQLFPFIGIFRFYSQLSLLQSRDFLSVSPLFLSGPCSRSPLMRARRRKIFRSVSNFVLFFFFTLSLFNVCSEIIVRVLALFIMWLQKMVAAVSNNSKLHE